MRNIKVQVKGWTDQPWGAEQYFNTLRIQNSWLLVKLSDQVCTSCVSNGDVCHCELGVIKMTIGWKHKLVKGIWHCKGWTGS